MNLISAGRWLVPSAILLGTAGAGTPVLAPAEAFMKRRYASKSRHQQIRKRECYGKFCYRDINQAELEIDRALEFRGETLRHYVCSKCRKIHLTSMTMDEYRRRS